MQKHLNLPLIYISQINRRGEADVLARDYMAAVESGSDAGSKLGALVDFFNIQIAPGNATEREWYNYMVPIVDYVLVTRRRTTEIVSDLQSPMSHKPEHVSKKQEAILGIMRRPGPLEGYSLIAGRTELMYLLRMERAPHILHYDGSRYVAVANVADAPRERRGRGASVPRGRSGVRSDVPLRAEAEDVIGSRSALRRGASLRQTQPRAAASPPPGFVLSRVARAAAPEPEATPEVPRSDTGSAESDDDLDSWLPDNNV